MAEPGDNIYWAKLNDRQKKLEDALATAPENQHLQRLMGEVDAALQRLETGTYGHCKECNDPIEAERLQADPLLEFCLDHLRPSQQRALEEDLELAVQIQNALLPPRYTCCNDLEVFYHYQGSGPVSGDYCDHLRPNNKDSYFMIGDVVGKGIAASMLMAHLHATFRTLVSLGLPLAQIVERASRMFCESTLSAHFATLVCVKAVDGGEIEICNAGHVSPLMIQEGRIEKIDATGLPLGMFCDARYGIKKFKFSPGGTILLYTDGLSEAQGASQVEYGTARLLDFVKANHSLPPRKLVTALEEDLREFRSGKYLADDLTIMVIRRLPMSE
jgi:sigma-B regulation protein RsbU (phosphoserine phosphatase)